MTQLITRLNPNPDGFGAKIPLEAISKMQITFKDKARDAGGVMCNIRKSGAYTGVCEHFEEARNAVIGR